MPTPEGAAPYRCHRLKQQLQELCDRIDLPIRVAHFPPGCSKWNYIEHRLFPHITRAMQGTVFESHEQVAQLMERATTKEGLHVKAYQLPGSYPPGEKAGQDYFECPPAIHHPILPDLNYTFLPKRLWLHWEMLIKGN